MAVETGYDIVLKDVSFSYNKNPVLENVNINVTHGEFATIIGPNGGGKTTLLKLLLGLLKPDKGKILVLGETPVKSKTKIGYMPQYMQLDMQFPVTVMDVVLMGRLGGSIFGRYSKKDRKLAKQALDEVEMAGFFDTMFNNLSGGQRQRVLIARALCGEPELLFLDEPTANVDPDIQENLLKILKEINERMTILIVSHDIGFVSKVVKSVICVNKRVIVHPTSNINGHIIRDIYGGDLRMIRHDHRCSEEGHSNV